MRLRKPLIFGYIIVYKKRSFHLQKNSVERLNFETKIVDNILKQILRTRSLVRPPDDSINQQNNDWKGRASESIVFFSFSY